MAQEFESGTIPPAVSFSTERVAPPSPLYVGREDRLIVRSWDASTATGCSVRGRVMLPKGFVQVFSFDHGFTGNRVLGTTFHALPEGFLLSLIVETAALSVRRGQAFVEVGIIRGQAAQAFRTAKLISGYVSDATPLAWPGDPLEDSVEGPGLIRAIVGTDPAADVEISETVPTNARWLLLGIKATLVTGAAAANRRPILVIDDGVNEVYAQQVNIDQVASQTTEWSWSNIGTAHSVTPGVCSIELAHPAYLMQGWRIRTETVARQAADNWGAPVLWVEEWLEE